VIRTKAAVTAEELGDRYFLIGPYNESCVRTELDIMEPPNEAVARAFQQMKDHGLKVCFCHSATNLLLVINIALDCCSVRPIFSYILY